MKKLTPEEWLEMRNRYVHGVIDDNGRREWPTLEFLSKRFGIAVITIGKRVKHENWAGQRADFERRLRDQIDREKRKDLAKEASEFDLTSLKLAKGLQNEIAQIIIESQEQRRVHKETLAAAKAAGLPAPASVRVLVPATLNSLASALSIAQKVGRLAMGETTENANVNINDQREFEEARRIIDELARGKRQDGPAQLH